ncbi:MAG: DUF2878 domain-containing protein [Cognaticolwellia sp.]|jgi:hypothetical protein
MMKDSRVYNKFKQHNAMILNIAIFNIAWFGLVFVGNLFIPIAVILLSIQFRYFPVMKNEIQLIIFVVTIGSLLDLSLVHFGIFTFPSTQGIPFWLITLWLCFASTIRHSLAFLANSRVLQCLVGGVFAPLSYLAGANFSAVQLSPSFAVSYVILACLWAPLMILIFTVSAWLLPIEEKANVG